MVVENAVHRIKLWEQERVELTSQGVATLLDTGYRSMLNYHLGYMIFPLHTSIPSQESGVPLASSNL